MDWGTQYSSAHNKGFLESVTILWVPSMHKMLTVCREAIYTPAGNLQPLLSVKLTLLLPSSKLSKTTVLFGKCWYPHACKRRSTCLGGNLVLVLEVQHQLQPSQRFVVISLLTYWLHHYNQPCTCHHFVHKNQWGLKGWMVEVSLIMDSALFQAWQLDYTKCTHRAFYLQMSFYSFSVSSYMHREFQLELHVQLSSWEPLLCLSQMFHLVLQHLSYSHLSFCHSHWISALL